MNFNLILLCVLIGFFGFKIYHSFSIKKKIPLLLKEGAIIVDVRTVGEYKGQANPESINIPLDRLSEECSKLDKNKTIILCCASGARSAAGLGILKKKGFQHLVNAGPWKNTIV